MTTSTVTAREAEQVGSANTSGRQPVVFIHGLWLLHSSWDAWRDLFEENGYASIAVDWPDDPASYAAAHTNPEVFAKKSVGQVADHVAGVIQGLNRKPVVIGHSFGGLLAQIIAGRGLALASVAIDPAPSRRGAAIAVLGTESVVPGAWQPGQLRQGGDPDVR